MVAAVTFDTALEGVERQMVHDLRKDELSRIHAFPGPSKRNTGDDRKAVRSLKSFTSEIYLYITDIQCLVRLWFFS